MVDSMQAGSGRREQRADPVVVAPLAEDAAWREGQFREAFADTTVGGAVRVQVVRHRKFGGVSLAVEVTAVQVVQVGVLGRSLCHDAGTH